MLKEDMQEPQGDSCCFSAESGAREVNVLQLYLSNLRFVSLLTPEEENDLAVRAKNGEQIARTKLIEGSLRLVVKIAMTYLRFGIEISDLVEEGNLGLIHAIEKFDPSLGYRLSTYATWWIKQYIEKYIMNNRALVHIPEYVNKGLIALKKAEKKLHNLLNRAPTAQELALELRKDVIEIESLININQETVSLEEQGNGHREGEKSGSLAETIPDQSAVEMEQQIYLKSIRQMIDGWLSKLPEMQQEIIARRFGLRGYDTSTLEEIGKDLNLSRESVRQYQNAGLRKLQSIMEDLDIPFKY